LGLSFQGQGMLDLAFEKFRKCPIDDSVKELLYNLGLDFERKRQFNKAVAVYEHIQTADPKYKDIQNRIKMLKAAAEGAVFGTTPGVKRTVGETVVLEGLSAQRPTLGRYEIIKELGRGAMGIVYLGRDPKINRTVAIKTLQFEEGLSEEEIKSLKSRFFREAESAGNLTHPNIIRIFDAGEDYDIAYIAMELLEGEDLKKYCDKNNLMPIKKVVDIMLKVTDALDYAHQQGVVHRDIKPANIMELRDGSIRITDFGIARIVATSQTQTGTVLGTPSYMSPEQVAGKKVDGRADIFSLGVTFYELLTGEKPFKGDSIATLIYQITNEKHPDPRQYRPEIPECIVNVIDKALKKNPDERYQRAKEMHDDLKKCLEMLM
ncbi:MAG: protein kinase domain-containing protein, partial [Endomicrobiia bacterium]